MFSNIFDKVQDHTYKLLLEQLDKNFKRLVKKKKFNLFEFNDYLDIFSVGEILLNKYFGIRLTQDQILAIVNLYKGNLIELPTGQGKTFVIFVLSLLIYRFNNQKIQILTFNEFLSNRDKNLLFDLYNEVGIEVLTINYESINFNKKGILFSVIDTIINLIFENFYQKGIQILNQLKNTVIILDELDSIIIDKSLFPAILSVDFDHSYPLVDKLKYLKLTKLANKIKSEVIYFNSDKRILITNKTIFILKKYFKQVDIEYKFENLQLLYLILICEKFYIKGNDYLIKNNKILFIDQNTNRTIENIKFDNDIQFILSIKEQIAFDKSSINIDYISIPFLLSYYKDIFGLSASLKSVEYDCIKILNKKAVFIKSYSKVIIKDYFCINKLKFIHLLIKQNIDKVPILIIAKNINLVNYIYDYLKLYFLNLQILHGNLDSKSEQIILLKAGLIGQITISTNVIVRGVDIKLGKNEIESNYINNNGGLFLIIFEHFIDERVDLQAIGRTARFNLNGRVCFLVNNKDDIFFQYNVSKFVNKYNYNYYIKIIRNQFEAFRSKNIDEINSISYTINYLRIFFIQLINRKIKKYKLWILLKYLNFFYNMRKISLAHIDNFLLKNNISQLFSCYYKSISKVINILQQKKIICDNDKNIIWILSFFLDLLLI